MEPSSSNTIKFLTFGEKKAFIIFRETEILKKYLILQKTETLLNFASSKKVILLQEGSFES